MPEILLAEIYELDLSVRVFNIMKRHGIDYVWQFMQVTLHDLNEWAREDPMHACLLSGARLVEEIQADWSNSLTKTV